MADTFWTVKFCVMIDHQPVKEQVKSYLLDHGSISANRALVNCNCPNSRLKEIITELKAEGYRISERENGAGILVYHLARLMVK